MTVPWSNLPPELWSIVFNHVESLKTVAECRLVCKAWDSLAERAMFSKPLSFRGENDMVKFCNRLQENPSLRYYIRFLSMGGGYQMNPVVFEKDLFKLIMNPNIISLDGWFYKASLNNLVDAVKELGEQCYKLETLRTWGGYFDGDESYLDAQFYFKASLRELYFSLRKPHTLSYQNVAEHLDQFSNLKELVLLGYDPQNLRGLERMLKQCQHLDSLVICELRGKLPSTSKEELKQWMIRNVQQSSSLKIATVGENDHPHLVEYLMFKYPNIHEVTLSIASTDDDHENIGRLLDAVKSVDNINLEYWYLQNATEVDHTLSTLKSSSNVFILRPCRSGFNEGILISLGAMKHKNDNTTHCKICILEKEYSAMFNRIIKDIASFPDLKVDYTDEDVMLVESGAVYQGDTAFKRLIDIMTIAVDVCFTCTYITCPSVPVNALSFQQLETLKICGAVIDQKVLALISKTTPKLKNLTFSSCILNPANPQHYQINMPHTDLGRLFIVSEHAIWESYDDDLGNTEDEYDQEQQNEAIEKIDSKVSIERNQLVFVKMTCLSSSQVEHYNLKPGGSRPAKIKAVSEDEYSACAPGWPNITIACKSLESLKLDLGALMVELKPGIDQPMEGTDDWRQTKEAALLLNELYNS